MNSNLETILNRKILEKIYSNSAIGEHFVDNFENNDLNKFKTISKSKN